VGRRDGSGRGEAQERKKEHDVKKKSGAKAIDNEGGRRRKAKRLRK
jgi:hypothetical protein